MGATKICENLTQHLNEQHLIKFALEVEATSGHFFDVCFGCAMQCAWYEGKAFVRCHLTCQAEKEHVIPLISEDEFALIGASETSLGKHRRAKKKRERKNKKRRKEHRKR